MSEKKGISASQIIGLFGTRPGMFRQGGGEAAKRGAARRKEIINGPREIVQGLGFIPRDVEIETPRKPLEWKVGENCSVTVRPDMIVRDPVSGRVCVKVGPKVTGRGVLQACFSSLAETTRNGGETVQAAVYGYGDGKLLVVKDGGESQRQNLEQMATAAMAIINRPKRAPVVQPDGSKIKVKDAKASLRRSAQTIACNLIGEARTNGSVTIVRRRR